MRSLLSRGSHARFVISIPCDALRQVWPSGITYRHGFAIGPRELDVQVVGAYSRVGVLGDEGSTAGRLAHSE